MTEPTLCGFDLETPQDIPEYGLQPWRARTGEATIKTVALWISDEQAVTKAMPSTEWFRKFLQHCIDSKVTLVGWNLLFDISWLHAIGLTEQVNQVKWIDAMLLLKRLDGWRNRELKGKGYGLKGIVAERWPEHADYGMGDDVVKVPQTEAEWVRLMEYNLLDSKFACLLAKEYLERLTPEEQRAARQEALGLSPIALSSINGIHINEEALDALNKDVAERRDKELRLLSLVTNKDVLEVIASPKKLGILMFEDWAFAPVKTTPAGANATDKETLLTLELENPEDPRMRSLMNLRRVNTQQSKFVDSVKASMLYHGEALTRPGPIIAGTYTGRLTYGSSQGKGKNEIQTGIAIHQWERDKKTRAILQAPEGFLIAEFDASGQEMRLMAEASQDQTMLKLFADGIDGHAFMGAAIEGKDWEWVSSAQDKDAEAKRIRNLGKFCIAEGELVLTDRGLVPIEKVLLADRVWDGIEWVNHDGLIYQGERDVITYQGLTATPDHKVWLEDGRTSALQIAASEGLQIATSGHGRRAIWSMDAFEFHRNTETEKHIRRVQMRLRCGCNGCLAQLAKCEINHVQKLRNEAISRVERSFLPERRFVTKSPEEVRRYEAEMSEQARSELPKLRSAWNRFQIQYSSGRDSVGSDKPATPDIFRRGHRSDQQQQPLRGWESSARVAERESAQHPQKFFLEVPKREHPETARISRIENDVPGCDVHGRSGSEPCVEWADSCADSRQVSQAEKLQTKRTYDLANAGCRHRFTVSGKLVSNCNLSLQYRIGVDTIRVRALTQYGLNLGAAKSKHIKAVYLQTYQGVPDYWKSAIRLAGQQGYAETFGHRRIVLNDINKYEHQQTAINFPIQGTGGDMKTLAIACLRPEFNDDVRYAWDLHDALFLYVRDDARALETVKRIRQKLNDLPYELAWGWKPSIPLPWDAKWGRSWGELKAVD